MEEFSKLNYKLDYDMSLFYKNRNKEDLENYENKFKDVRKSNVSKNKNTFDPHLNNILWNSEIVTFSSEVSFQASISSYDNNEPKFYVYKLVNTSSREIPYKKMVVLHLSLKEFSLILSFMQNVINIFENFFYTYLKEEREKIDQYIKHEFSLSHHEEKIEDLEKTKSILENIK